MHVTLDSQQFETNELDILMHDGNPEKPRRMLENTSTVMPESRPADGVNLSIDKARMLDIPLIFQLLLDGGIAGAFSDRYLFEAGHLKLFWWIVQAIAPWPLGRRKTPGAPRMVVIYKGGQDVGFAQIQHSTTSSGAPMFTLLLLALAKQHHGKNIGAAVVARLMSELPDGVIFEVYCSKYARAMQHILHKMRFKRDKLMLQNLTRFTFHKGIRQEPLALPVFAKPRGKQKSPHLNAN